MPLKILYVCHRFPYPPKRGGKIRPFNMISHLTRAGHEVTVASLVRSATEAEEGAGLAQHCAASHYEHVGRVSSAARMLARLPTRAPSSFGYFYSPRLRRHIADLVQRQPFDLLFAHCSSVAPYVAHVPIPKILDFGDMDSQKWLAYRRFQPFPWSLGYWLEGRKLEAEEKRLARQFDLCTCTTRAEHETLVNYGTGARTAWFPNGVDTGFFAPDSTEYDSRRIGFVGRMDYFPNQQAVEFFCRDVLPLVRRAKPDAEFAVIGADPPRRIRELGRLPGVTVTGSVPDVRPHVRRCALTVAPLMIARGTQNKILESMAMGVPVVASTAAAGGVDAVEGEHLLVADEPEPLAQAVVGVLERPAERERLAVAARERVRSHHSWASSMQRLDALIAGVVHAGEPSR